MNISVVANIPETNPEWACLFNSIQFYELHKTDTCFFLSFYVEETLVAVIHFSETDPSVFNSIRKGTFGGFDFKTGLSLSLKNDCVNKLDEYFKSNQAKKVIISSAPFAHDVPQSASLFNAFLNVGYDVILNNINHTLDVDEVSLIDKMKRNNKKRLKKCNREGFVFEQVSSDPDYETVYDAIAENRANKGYSISMSFKQIMEMVNQFPNNIFFFRSLLKKEVAAASICLKISDSILYVFYWGDPNGYQQYSPITHLANGIYEFANANGFKLIDAGTSSLAGEPNYGVATFKENLGFSASLKLTYSKTYE